MQGLVVVGALRGVVCGLFRLSLDHADHRCERARVAISKAKGDPG